MVEFDFRHFPDVEIAFLGVVPNLLGKGAGRYLISRVTHLLTDASYKQTFSLVRNARSAGAGGGVPSLPGGLV